MLEKLWKVLAVSFALYFSPPALGWCQVSTHTTFEEEKRTRPVRDRYNFLAEDTGTVAMLPAASSLDSARHASYYEVLPESGFYSIEEKSDWFIVNHRLQDAENRPPPTYVGILAVKVLKPPLEMQLELIRNESKHWMPKDGGFRKDFPSASGFWERHAENGGIDLSAFESEFGLWHTALKEELHTSDRSTSWKPTHHDCWSKLESRGRSVSDDQVFVQARLYAFTPTRSRYSGAPVVWKLALRNASAVYIRTFSPNRIDFSGRYCIEFRP